MRAAPSRRRFLAYGVSLGGALVVACRATERPGRPSAPDAPQPPGAFRPNAWVRVGQDGRVTVTVGKSEMGQGVRTALPAIVADELGVEMAQVTVEQASPGPAFGELGTSGSRSLRTLWEPLRRAGAAAREVLIAAAAARWGAPAGECRGEQGAVVHGPTGRRLGYGELVAEASRLPVPEAPRLKPRRELRLVGRDLARVDGPAIVRGAATFSADVRVEGQAFAVVARCPVFGGKAARWSEAEARRVPGVLAVVPIGAGLAVVGATTWAAIAGRAALEPTIAWDEGPHREHGSADAWRELGRAHAGPVAWLGEGAAAAEAIGRAARRVRAEYAYPYQAHAPLEPRNATARVREGGCEIWAGTQGPNRLQEAAAKLLGVPADKVVVHVPLIGGSFGQKSEPAFALEAVEVSKAIGRPAQVLFTRQDDLHQGRFHPASLHRLEAGLDAAGRVVGLRQVAALTSPPLAFGQPMSDELLRGALSGAWDSPYDAAASAAGLAHVPLPAPVGPWRGVANVSHVFARECFVDEVALAAGEEPLAFRLRRLRSRAAFRGGRDQVEVDPARLAAALEAAARALGPPGAGAAGRGRGFACNVYDGHTYAALAIELAPGEGGRLAPWRVVCAVDAGVIVNPQGARAQIEGSVVWGLSALWSQITLRAGRVEQSTYADYPVLRLGEAPKVETLLLPSEAPPVGLGEPAVPLVAPAFLNALFAATGRRVRRLPLGAADVAWPAAGRR
ncbi:MAG TPA: molybdopterin cofactor-binding domain-containing protein [Polyangiaceae bacterium]|nr:molybdopterin cofactor-binding domain-containing protein [Polyangiaceae bacterium]